MGGTHDRLRHLRRQQVRHLDRRRADGDHLVRDLPVLRDRHRAAARRTMGLRDALALAQANGRLRIIDPSPEPDRALHALERAHRRAVPDAVVLRVRPEPGAALPVGQQPHPEPAVAALQRVPQGPDAVPDPAHRRAGVRLLPLPARAAALELGRAARGWRRQAAPAEVAALRARFEAAHAARRGGRGAFLRDRAATGGDAERERYLETGRALDAVRKEVRAEVEKRIGRRDATTTPTTSSRPTSSPTCRAAWPASSSP